MPRPHPYIRRLLGHYRRRNLAVFAPPLDQTAVTTHYLPDGTPGPQGVTTFARGAGPLALPRATNWSAGIDHQIGGRVYLSANYLRRRARDGFVYVTPWRRQRSLRNCRCRRVLDGALPLTNQRLDSYQPLPSLSGRPSAASILGWPPTPTPAPCPMPCSVFSTTSRSR